MLHCSYYSSRVGTPDRGLPDMHCAHSNFCLSVQAVNTAGSTLAVQCYFCAFMLECQDSSDCVLQAYSDGQPRHVMGRHENNGLSKNGLSNC